jgi:hypothetical protein
MANNNARGIKYCRSPFRSCTLVSMRPVQTFSAPSFARLVRISVSDITFFMR